MQLYTITKFVYFKKLKRCNKTLKLIIPMKKILLFVFVSILSISAFAANPNPYAYDLMVSAYDEENFKVTLQYSLNAPATSVKIYVQDSGANSYLLKEFGTRNAGTHSVEIDLLDAMQNKGVPAGQDLSWSVEVRCAARTIKAETCGRKINFRSPFSIDIDNNPKSPYFGRIVTTQANSNETRGLRAYKPNFTQIGSNYIGNIVKFPSGNWYNNTHLTPFRIRVLQDGTGRIFVSSADVGQSTYMWQVNPANLNDWSVFLTSAEIISKTGYPEEDDTMGNNNFDFRKNDKGEWELLLLSASIDEKTKNCSSGYSYSGIYTLGEDLSKKSYTNYVKNVQGAPHAYVDDWFVASFLSGNAQFDPNGDILYSSYHLNTRPEESALIHHQIKTDVFSSGYDAFERLRRENTATGAIRYSGDFSKLAVANGGLTKEVSICTPNHSREYLTISSIEAVDMITTAHNTAYIVDFAWDYADNLYACVRNSDDSAIRGVWVIAWNLNGEPVTTPARENQKFSIPCTEADYTVTCQATEGGRIVDGFSGGTQKACTQMTVKAEPVDNNYKFDKWTDQSGKTVSTNAEYTFRVVKDVQLTAHFSGAVFNVTWWNLFQGGKDIAKESTAYPNTNERLWRLYQVELTAYLDGTKTNQSDHTINGKKQFDVAGFIAGRAENNVTFLEQYSAFHWLERYLTWVNGLEILDKKSQNSGNSPRYTRLQYMLYLFFNRTDVAYNSAGNYNTTYLINGADEPNWWKKENGVCDYSKSFEDYGTSIYWRPWWTEYVCGLNSVMYYHQDMPITWNQNPCASGTVPGMTATEETQPSQWYQWNTADGKLLAWREGGTDPEKNRIVHHVDKSMALYATYVDKHISESKDNDDVIRLMQNSGYASTPHRLTVDRKLQAGMYNTICLPFSLDVTTLHDHPLENAEVLDFTGVNELYDETGENVAVLQFEKVTTLQAGKPYLIQLKGNDNVTEPMDFTGVTYNDLTYVNGTKTAELSGGGGLITFNAIISPKDIPEGSIILVSDNRLAKVTTKGQMLGLRGYFTINDTYVQSLADEGKLYLSIKKPTTTSIPVAPEAEQQKAPKVRKIMQDGHIYIIRGEEVYDTMGRRVE